MALIGCDIADRGEATIDTEGTTTLIDTYIAVMDTPADTLGMLVSAVPGLAQRGRPHPRIPGLRVSSFEARQDANFPTWTVRVTYSDKIDEENPLAKPVSVTIRSARISSYTLVDNRGRMMVNAAGDPFEPQEKFETLLSISLKKNLADYPSWLLDYPESINNDGVRIRKLTCPPKTLLFSSLNVGDYQTAKNGVDYLTIEVELLFRRSTWKTVVPNRGFNQLVKDRTGKKKIAPIKNDKDEPIREPALLDRDGALIPTPKPQDIVILSFTIPDERPFGVLPLK